jgi:three-Cys-motif partner protein
VGQHIFGGNWTNEKLERVRKYLTAYTTIFKGNARAAYFETTYLDAFAGSGSRVDSTSQSRALQSDAEEDGDAESLQKGSARIALEVEPSFDRYVFIEERAKRVTELEALRHEFIGKSIQIERAEAITSANIVVT